MTRRFYTDPLAAAWMHIHFGMELECPGLFGDVIRAAVTSDTHLFGVAHLASSFEFRAFVHTDSLHLLEPQSEDKLQIVGGHYHGSVVHCAVPETMKSDWTGGEEWQPTKYQGFRIIQRDGKVFHWPESEAV